MNSSAAVAIVAGDAPATTRVAGGWVVWVSLASVTSILVGAYWDISWHMSIGRDSFWTPAHLLIQAGGITAGLSGTYQIVSTTLRVDAKGVRR